MGKETIDFPRHLLLLLVGILIFLAPIRFGLPIEYSIHWLWRIGIVILFILWLVWGITTGRFRLRFSLLDIIITIFLLSAVISTFKAPNIHLAHICLTQYLVYVLTYFLILNILEDTKDLKFLMGVLIIPALLISMYAIYQSYVSLPQTKEFANLYIKEELSEYVKMRLETNRPFATFIYPNTLAGYLVLCIPLGMWVKNKGARFLIIVTMLYAIYLTFYKGSSALEKIGNAFVFRLENWVAGVRMIKGHPIFGVGTNNFSVFYPRYKLDIAEEIVNAHNNFLQIWAEQGIFGFLSFFLLWLIVIKNGLRSKGLAFGIVAFAIHNLVDFDWYVPGLTIIAWVIIAIIVWTNKGYREKVFKINRWLGLLIILPVSVFILFYLEKNLLSDYYIEKAKEVFHKGDYPLTELLCRTAINLDKDNPEPYFLLGKVCTYKMDYTNSIEWYKKAIKYDPYNPSCYYNLGLVEIYAGFTKDVHDAFKKAVELYPTNPFYHFQLGQFYETNNQRRLALREYNYCLRLNSKIERECRTRGKMMRHLLLDPSVIEDVKRRIRNLLFFIEEVSIGSRRL